MKPRYQIDIVTYASHQQDIRLIRQAVFVAELNIPAELEFDAQDEQAKFALAKCDSQAIGTGRVLTDGHIGRIAVLAHWRRQGIGTGILNQLIQLAEQQQLDTVFLSAQRNSVEIYKKPGFIPQGDTFRAAEIVHRNMEKKLSQDIIKSGAN